MVILQNPDAARSLGLLGAKAALTAGTADWPTFLSMLGQALTVGGAVLCAVDAIVADAVGGKLEEARWAGRALPVLCGGPLLRGDLLGQHR